MLQNLTCDVTGECFEPSGSLTLNAHGKPAIGWVGGGTEECALNFETVVLLWKNDFPGIQCVSREQAV
jgi:hypothetical protein